MRDIRALLVVCMAVSALFFWGMPCRADQTLSLDGGQVSGSQAVRTPEGLKVDFGSQEAWPNITWKAPGEAGKAVKQIGRVMVFLLVSCLMAGCYHPHIQRDALPSVPVSTPTPISWRRFLAARLTHPGRLGWWTRVDLDGLDVRPTHTSARVRWRGAQITMPWDDDPSPLPPHFHVRQYGDDRPVPLKGGMLYLPTPQSTQVWAGD